jgi:hypothetical protein
MRKTKNNMIKAAISADGVKFTINGMYDSILITETAKLQVFKTVCYGGSIADDQPFGRQMNIDKERSNGRFLALYSYDLMRNKTTSKIPYSHINILN